MRAGDVIITPVTYCWGLSWIVTQAGGGREVLEQGGGVDGHKARAGSGVMGGRGFLFLRETRKGEAQSVPQTQLLASRKRERAFGKL